MSNAVQRDDEIDLKSVVDAKFEAWEGLLTFNNDTPDKVIRLAIKRALKVGKP